MENKIRHKMNDNTSAQKMLATGYQTEGIYYFKLDIIHINIRII